MNALIPSPEYPNTRGTPHARRRSTTTSATSRPVLMRALVPSPASSYAPPAVAGRDSRAYRPRTGPHGFQGAQMDILADAIVPASGNAQLVAAALLGIAAVVVLISGFKMHPFLALILGTGVLGVVAGFGVTKTIDSFTKGVGSTVGSVGLLIALGAMLGGLLADSGGADRIVEAVVDNVSAHRLPWAMGGVAALIGLPLFFEVGVVLLVPVVVLVSIRSRVNLLKIGIPALAGLSVLHGLVPPHPGPLVAIDALKADLGTTLALGLIIAIPTVILAGPVFGNLISRRVNLEAPRALLPEHALAGAGAPARADLAPGDDLVDPGTPAAARTGGAASAAGTSGPTRR